MSTSHPFAHRALTLFTLWLGIAIALPATARQIAGELVREMPATTKSVAAVTPAQALQQIAPALVRAERSRVIAIDAGALTIAQGDTKAKRDSALQIGFFDDAKFTIEITGSERTSSGGVALMGRIAGDPMSSAVLVDNNGVLSVGVTSGGRKFGIQGSPERGFVAVQLPVQDELDGHGHENDFRPAPRSASEQSAAKTGTALSSSPSASKATTPGPVTNADDGSQIDVMVAYTPAAKAANGGTAQIEANIDAQVAYTNLIYQNSGVIQRIRLVHKVEIAHTESDIYTDIDKMYQGTPAAGQLAILRDTYAADIVSVWGVWNQACGIAFVWFNEHPDGQRIALNMVNSPGCATPTSITFAHELGHNMGLHHDWQTRPYPIRITPPGSPTSIEVKYGHGYIDIANRFRTVMSQSSYCFEQLSVDCKRIPFFSNPSLTYDNTSHYASASPTAPMGEAVYGDETRLLNHTRHTVANYRVSADGAQLNVLTFTQSELNAFESVGNATLTVSRPPRGAGAVSVSYATANGTAIAGTDYTATSGTLNWANGDNADKTISVPLTPNTLVDGTRTFTVTLSNPTGGAVAGTANGTGALATVNILDDEPDIYPPNSAMPTGFTTPGASNAAWTIDLTRGYKSVRSIQSANVLNGTSDLEYTGNFGAGNVTFALSMNSPETTSSLQFMIDGVVVHTQAGGLLGWTTISKPITAGNHTLRWRYVSTDTEPCFCANRAWIDDVTFPAPPAETKSALAFIANTSGGSVSVIDMSTHTVFATIPVGTSPWALAALPDGSRVYVANLSTASVSVIDTTTQKVIKTIPTGTTTPFGVAASPDSTRVYVTHTAQAVLTVIDTATDTTLPAITLVGASSRGITVSADGTRAYVGNFAANSVEVVDLVNKTSMGLKTMRNKTMGVTLQPGGAQLWTAQNGDKSVALLDTATQTMGSVISVGGTPNAIAFHPGNNRAYATTGAPVSGQGGNSVAVIDVQTRQVTNYITVGNAPFGIGVRPDGVNVYSVNAGSNNVSVIDVATNTVVTNIPVGSLPRAMGDFVAQVPKASVPKNVAVVAGDGTATLSFAAPQFDGGSPILHYQGTCQPGNLTATAASSPVVVSGLANGVAHTCSVRAVTARGPGGASPELAVSPLAGTFITSVNAASFPVLTAGSFTVQTTGAPVTSFTYTGSLPTGVTLSTAGVLSGTPATGTAGDYPIVITANNTSPPAGTQNFTLTVTKLAQAITFASPGDRSFSEGTVALTATGGASGNAVTFASTTPAVCTVSGTTVTYVTAGYCTINADQAGDANYSAAPQVQRTFYIRATQTLSLTLPADLPAGVTLTLAPTGGGSDKPILITTTTPTVCSSTGTNGVLLKGLSIGTCTVLVNQAGNAFYDPAQQLTLNVPVVRGPQTITHSTTSLSITGGAQQRITASGGSGNPVVLTSASLSICTTDGITITPLEFGRCVIKANQAGNADFFAAPETTITLPVVAMMGHTRGYHQAGLLPNGRVLVLGGYRNVNGGIWPVYETYDPATRTWTAGTELVANSFGAASVMFPDGGMMVTGGRQGTTDRRDMAIYNPPNVASSGFLMNVGRSFHTAVRLTDGRVLVSGGGTGNSDAGINSAEIFNLSPAGWTAVPNMTQRRRLHAATLLPDGRVLVTGGMADGNPLATAEIYDPAANTWTAVAPMLTARVSHTSHVVSGGKVLVVGGSADTAERYNIATNTWEAAGSVPARYGHTGTLLDDGRVLVAGGIGAVDPMQFKKETLLYDPALNTWSTGPNLTREYSDHTATLLPDGTVFLAGGVTAQAQSTIHNESEPLRLGMSLPASELPEARINAAYGPVSLAAVGGAQPVTYAVTAGALPVGITLSTAGALSGTPTATGTATFTVTATDANMQSASREFTLLVTLPAVTVTPSVVGTFGSISPMVPKQAAQGSTVTYLVSANFPYSPSVGGTCGGTLTGNVYTTAPLTADCTVILSFVQTTFAPGTPTVTNVVPDVYSAHITFTPPSDGGSPITNYEVECIGVLGWGPTATTYHYGTSSPITTGYLQTTYSHKCSVRAQNAVGWGPRSTPSNGFSVFMPPLTITVVMSGNGANVAGNRVTAPGIDCPGDCTDSRRPSGSGWDTYTAVAGLGAYFSGWAPHTFCQGMHDDFNTCDAQFNTRTIEAVFVTTPTAPSPPLTGTVEGIVGGIKIQPWISLTGGSPITSYTGTCTPQNGGAVVSATVPAMTAAQGYPTINVLGLTPGVAYVCTVAVTNAIGTSAQSAAYSAKTPLAGNYDLTVTKAGSGRGTVTSSPGSIVCGDTCVGNYAGGITVTLTAQATEGSTFMGWSGGTGSATCMGTGTCMVAMGTHSTIVANFKGPDFTVTPSAGANGSISPNTPQTVNYGSTATFTVTANAGFVASVGGTCGGTLTGNTYTTVGISSNCTVVASFAPAGGTQTRRFDLTGNGTSDVIWYHTGVFGVIGMNANGLSLDPYYIVDVQSDANWKIAGIGDLNGDGKADVVWYNSVTGEAYGLLMNGGTVLSEGRIALETNLDWKPEQVADLDGDGKADLVWKNQATGDVFVMLLNGLTQTGGQVVYTEPNLNWKIIASGDMNGDGRADLLWRNIVTGDVFAMIMNGFTVVSGGVIYTEPNLAWKIIGLADYNADGKADVLWQNTATGEVFQMQMNGTVSTAGQVIYTEPNTQWKIVALGDYNGDGKADILWQNTATGQVFMLLMDGFTVTSSGIVYTEPDTQWQIVGP